MNLRPCFFLLCPYALGQVVWSQCRHATEEFPCIFPSLRRLHDIAASHEGYDVVLVSLEHDIENTKSAQVVLRWVEMH
jgi:hypothetical protein